MSPMMMMVSAFTGYDLMREVYDVAIKEKYKFFTYGDAMLII
jgi:S-adenosylmethionine:tRNA ribosyltransferase-isomerase